MLILVEIGRFSLLGTDTVSWAENIQVSVLGMYASIKKQKQNMSPRWNPFRKFIFTIKIVTMFSTNTCIYGHGHRL